MSTTPFDAGDDVEFTPMRDTDTRLSFGIAIGVDVGRRNLLTLAPGTAAPEIDEALSIGTRGIEEHYAELRDRHDRGWGVDEVLAGQLDDVLTASAMRAIAFALSFDEPPVLVLEDLSYDERSLDDCVTSGAGADCWLLSGIQQRLRGLAREQDIPVAVTTEENTTKECHVCGDPSKIRDETLKCTTEGCPVDVVDRDRSAAVTIAKRLG